MKNRSIAFKLIFLFSITCVLMFLMIFGFFYRFTRRVAWRDIEQDSRLLAESTAGRIESIMLPVQEIPEGLSIYLEHAPLNKETMLKILKVAVEGNPDAFGSAIAFEPYAFDGKSEFFCPYYFKEDGQAKLKWLGGDSYRYFFWDWYQIPKEIGRNIWSEPYMDVGGGNIMMATYSVPFYRTIGGRRRFAGVVTVDISLDWLTRIIEGIKVLETGNGFLVSKNGTFVAHPSKNLIMNETIFSYAEAFGDPRIRRLAKRMIRGETGFVPIPRMTGSENAHMSFLPIPSTGWSLAVVFPDKELMAGMHRLTWIIVLVAIGGLCILLLLVASECRSITRPLTAMADATGAIAQGNLDIDLPQAMYHDEVGKLADAFLKMRESLKDYISRLTEATAAKQRIESELGIARDIQLGMVPKSFPPFPGLQEVDMHALLVPARQVGGDLFDFFPLGHGRFCFLIGDVSGKGVPASLFMAVTMTLLKSTASYGLGVDAVLDRVNDSLVQRNDNSLFVTVFVGVLNLRTGELEYSNGGHNFPVILRSGGSMERLDGGRSHMLGVVEGARFGRGSALLEPGDRIFLFTDGVSEAMDPSGALFSEGRMLKNLHSARLKSPKDMVLSMLSDVERHSGGDHSDDIAMMLLRFLGPSADAMGDDVVSCS
jgi:sigma-B regulation protein RsbU (phosphoserine phosphatase)